MLYTKLHPQPHLLLLEGPYKVPGSNLDQPANLKARMLSSVISLFSCLLVHCIIDLEMKPGVEQKAEFLLTLGLEK